VDLNPRFRFETFVVGPSNRLAATAAQAVAQSPGAAYNPLFLYGRSGLGKTHLLNAVGFGAREHQANLAIRYLTLEEFVEQFHAAVAAGQVDAFRHGLEETGALLLDDVQFLAKHREMQAELLRLSEAMSAKGRQLVLTADRPPAEIGELDERLISRLSGGLLVDLAPPDYETRLAILRRKAEERKVVFETGVLEAVAGFEATNVRELVGLVNRLIAFQAVSEAPIKPQQARALLVGEEEAAAADAAPAAPPAKTETATPAAAPAPAAAAKPPDEFSAFLSAVSRTVAQSIDAWRNKVGEAVLRWSGEGFRTARLEAMLQGEALPDVDAQLARYASDADTLKRLAAEAQELDPGSVGHARFKDPDKVADAEAFVEKLREGLAPPPPPSAALTLAEYVEGAANEAVVRAAKLVAHEPGRRFNPLYVAGPSGVGKSHLLHAIGNALAAGPPPRIVACLTATAFVEELLGAIEAGKVDAWRRRYRRADAFLLDDVHLIAGKEQTQDELFNLFNVLAEGDRQLVFAADRPPNRLEGIEPRLMTRFEGGLVVELTAPDRAMREVMVRRLLDAQDVKAEGEVVQYLAARPADSARAVQGLVNRALSAMDASDHTLSLQAARVAIEGRAARPSQAQAVSAPVPSGIDPLVASREKVVWDWPEMADRVVEDLR
jgi:chromosomal replication initiator protein